MLLDLFYINPFQYHRLFTHEDKHYYHAHKIIGGVVLIHFIYRIWLFLNYKNMFFDASSYTTLFWILLHFSLHITSFQFVIPTHRNKTYTIIWPEMRIHTMLFAYRSLITMLIIWLRLNEFISPLLDKIIRPFIVLGTIAAADYTTYYYKYIKKKVSINDSTMRGMPYPSYVPKWYTILHNYFYSISQVFATMYILNSKSMESIFLLLIPIQTAPFGMTLVKKGIINQGGWHLYYSISLLINFVYSIFKFDDTSDDFFKYKTLLVIYFIISRFIYHKNKYLLWSLISGCILYT